MLKKTCFTLVHCAQYSFLWQTNIWKKKGIMGSQYSIVLFTFNKQINNTLRKGVNYILKVTLVTIWPQSQKLAFKSFFIPFHGLFSIRKQTTRVCKLGHLTMVCSVIFFWRSLQQQQNQKGGKRREMQRKRLLSPAK